MDYYKVLGLGREASKEEIKDAFRKLALKFHPDRHAKSSTAVQDDAMRRFKEVSEAYDVLSNDKKRTAYNYGTTGFHSGWNGSARGRGSGSGSAYYRGGGYSTYQRRATSRNWGLRFGPSLLYFSTMDFLLHAVLAGVFLGGLFVADATGKALWQRQNTGKSFEESVNALNQMKEERSSSTQKVKDSDET